MNERDMGREGGKGIRSNDKRWKSNECPHVELTRIIEDSEEVEEDDVSLLLLLRDFLFMTCWSAFQLTLASWIWNACSNTHTNKKKWIDSILTRAWRFLYLAEQFPEQKDRENEEKRTRRRKRRGENPRRSRAFHEKAKACSLCRSEIAAYAYCMQAADGMNSEELQD